jgi:hypothetical protein
VIVRVLSVDLTAVLLSTQQTLSVRPTEPNQYTSLSARFHQLTWPSELEKAISDRQLHFLNDCPALHHWELQNYHHFLQHLIIPLASSYQTSGQTCLD